MEFADRNEIEIQKMVDQILAIAANGLKWARQRESQRLDREEECIEWGPGDTNDEGYLIAESVEPLPTQLSLIKTILLLLSEPAGSDEENVVRCSALLSDRKITNQTVFTVVAMCCDFYALGWMARHTAGNPPFQHYYTAERAPVDSGGQLETSVAIAR